MAGSSILVQRTRSARTMAAKVSADSFKSLFEFDQEMEKGRLHLLPLGLEECRCRPSVPRKSAIRVAIIA